MTTTPGADLALAAAYRDWFQLCRQERLGALPSHAECAETLRVIRLAERAAQDRDGVYAATLAAWLVEHDGEAP